MPNNRRTQNPALDIEYGSLLVVSCAIVGYFAEGTAFGFLVAMLAAICYLLYRIWWSVELVATQL